MNKLDNQVREDIINQALQLFDNLPTIGKKTIFKELGIDKEIIEGMDKKKYISILKKMYEMELKDVDLDNFNPNPKFIIVNEYLSGDKKNEFENKPKNY